MKKLQIFRGLKLLYGYYLLDHYGKDELIEIMEISLERCRYEKQKKLFKVAKVNRGENG